MSKTDPLRIEAFEGAEKPHNPKLDKKNMNKKNQMTSKFKSLLNTKKQYNCE